MEHSIFNADEEDNLIESAEYNVLSRPHELIAAHFRSSSVKNASPNQKSSSKDLKRKSPKKIKEKYSVRDKLMKNKLIKKALGDLKPSTEDLKVDIKSKVAKGSAQRSKMLDTKFDSLLKKAVKSMHTYSSNTEGTTDIIEKPTKQHFLKSVSESAFTPQERYDVLNARDNLIRINGNKEVQGKKISGSCPDMCPEKERYSRIAKNCLSLLETKLSSSKDVDHHYMVKEYSRSSADQQEPLPHELRPVSVLKYTMDYLICNIINQSANISTADWFDFIWNRTRSIRKDITQQQLCDSESVEIIEKCIRFHIFCAEALSEEDAATFDPRINNENLTKCLQTLKHMYYDLQTKGIECSNEAEFRAYDILLSLTEGETLRLVKDIDKKILRTPYLKFAFDVALAFESNNYVKFFNLMEKASYLNSCIMHRYIHKARIRAVQVIIRAYSTPSYTMMYPLLNLVRDLKFESELDAANFCRWHGLTADDTHVTIERQVFSIPSSVFHVSRSSRLVNNKLISGLGEVINNGPLPENPLQWYEPHNSFDDDGLLHDKRFSLELNENTNEETVEDMDQDIINQEKVDSSQSFIPTTVGETNQNSLSLLGIKTKTIEDKLRESYAKIENNVSFNVPQSQFQALSSVKSKTRQSLFTPTASKQFSPVQEPVKPKSFWDTSNQSKSSFTFLSPSLTKTKETSLHHSETSRLAKPIQRQDKHIPRSPLLTKPELSFVQSPSPFPSAKSSKWPVTPTQKEQAKSPCTPFPPKFQSPVTRAKSIEVENEWTVGNDTEPRSPLPPIIFHRESTDKNDNQDTDIESLEDNLSSEDEEDLLKKRSDAVDALISNVTDEVYNDCIEEFSSKICEEIVADEWNRKQEYEDGLAKMRYHLAVKSIYKWRLFCQRKKQRKSYEKFEPISPWVSMLINTEYVSSGATSPFTAYKKHCSVSRLADSKIKQQRQKPGWEPLEPLSFSSMNSLPNYPPAYLKNTGINRFFKLGIVFASYPNSLSTFLDWICTKFKLTKLPYKNEDKLKCLSFYTLNAGKTLVSIRCIVFGSSPANEAKEFLRGISGVVLCCPLNFPSQEHFKVVLQWMSLIFDDKNLPYPFPLFTFLLDTAERYDISESLASFLQERWTLGRNFSAIKSIQIPEVPNYSQCSNDLLFGIKWLVEMQEQPPEILNYSFRDYLEDSFAFAFNTLFWKLTLSEFKSLMQLPEQMIEFYNEVIMTRASLLNSDFLMKALEFWPPKEFSVLQPGYDFINIDVQRKCEEFMTNLCLPSFNGDPTNTADLWMYVNDITSPTGPNKELLILRIQKLLDTNSHEYWPHIISKCAYYVICNYCSKFESLLKKDIFLMKGDLEAVNFNRYWQLLSISLKENNQKTNKRKEYEYEYVEASKKRRDDKNLQSIPNTSIFSQGTFFSEIADVPDAASSKVNNMLHSLQAAFKEQNLQSDEFFQRLNDSIVGDDQNRGKSKKQPSSLFKSPAIDESFQNENNEHNSIFSTSSRVISEASNDWRTIVGRKPAPEYSSLSSISEKLEELKYNIQRNKILEENSSQLLDT